MDSTWQTTQIVTAPPGWMLAIEGEVPDVLAGWLVQEEREYVGIQSEKRPQPTGKTRVIAAVIQEGELVPFTNLFVNPDEWGEPTIIAPPIAKVLPEIEEEPTVIGKGEPEPPKEKPKADKAKGKGK